VELEKRRIEYDRSVMVSSIECEIIERSIKYRDIEIESQTQSKLNREPGSDLADPVL
jgi:hypothetical protein